MVPTLHISSLATRMAAPARLLAARFLGNGVAPLPKDEADDVVAEPAVASTSVENRHHVPILKASEAEKAWGEAIAHYAEMAESGHWSALLEELVHSDQNRTAAAGGRRLAQLISEGACSCLQKSLARSDLASAQNAMNRLEAELSAHPSNAAAAHILVKAHLDLGFALRSADPRPKDAEASAQGYADHFASAEAILEPFDPIETMSPLLAATRYKFARAVDDGEVFFRDWYEDWSDLDPSDTEPHRAHATNLLGDWFGSIENFDDEARVALKRTERTTGAAAYAVFYLSAAEELGDLPEGMDLPLFLVGLRDYFQATGCQYRANVVAAAMTELLNAYTIDAVPGSKRLKLVLEALTEHLTDNLREFHLSAWQNGLSGIQFALEQVFAKELALGEQVFVGVNGLTTRHPA